jgi:hypothetical protein
MAFLTVLVFPEILLEGRKKFTDSMNVIWKKPEKTKLPISGRVCFALLTRLHIAV